jgi:hypothetical protein
MRTSSQSSISPAITRTLTATIIAVILMSAHFTVIDAQQPAQQQSLQPGSDSGGLTASINSGSFTTGETITISGSVQQRGSSSNVVIEITDPQGQLVKRGFPSLSATDNTFTYSFVAGEQEQFDTNAPMVASGNYLVKVRYFPPSDGIVTEEVELSFVYSGTTTNATPTSRGVNNSSSITDLGAGSTQPGSPASTPAPVTSSSSRQGEVQNGTAATAATTFLNPNDGFSIDVPQSWQIHDVNNTGPAFSEESTRGYGILAQLCLAEQQLEQTQDTVEANGNSSSNNGCQIAQEEVIHIVRYPNLDGGISANNATNGTTTSTTTTTGASFNPNSNMTIGNAAESHNLDNILAYHIEKLQEVGYRGIQIVNNGDVRVNLTMSQANETITTLPAKFVEITYSTAPADGQVKRGYFILTATNTTAPNLGVTKGYSVFYEGNPAAAAEITATSAGPSSLPSTVGQVFDSFELIVAPEVEQAITQQGQPVETPSEDEEGSNDDDEGEGSNDDNDEGEGSNDDDEGEGSNDDDEGEGSNDDNDEGEGSNDDNDEGEGSNDDDEGEGSNDDDEGEGSNDDNDEGEGSNDDNDEGEGSNGGGGRPPGGGNEGGQTLAERITERTNSLIEALTR